MKSCFDVSLVELFCETQGDYDQINYKYKMRSVDLFLVIFKLLSKYYLLERPQHNSGYEKNEIAFFICSRVMLRSLEIRGF